MSLPFPQSKNHLLSVVDNLTYTERFNYASRLGREHKAKPALRTLVNDLLKHPDPPVPEMEADDGFTEILPAQRTTISKYYNEDQLALAIAVSAGMFDVIKERLTSPSKFFDHLVFSNYIRMKKGDSMQVDSGKKAVAEYCASDADVIQAILAAVPARRRLLIQETIQAKRLTIITEVVPQLRRLPNYAFKHVAHIIHACSSETVREFLTEYKFQNVGQVWNKIIKFHVMQVLELLEEDLGAEEPLEHGFLYDQYFNWAFSATKTIPRFLKNKAAMEKYLDIVIKYPPKTWNGPSNEPRTGEAGKCNISLPSVLMQNLQRFMTALPEKTTQAMINTVWLHYDHMMHLDLPVLNQMFTMRVGYQYANRYIKHALELTPKDKKIYKHQFDYKLIQAFQQNMHNAKWNSHQTMYVLNLVVDYIRNRQPEYAHDKRYYEWSELWNLLCVTIIQYFNQKMTKIYALKKDEKEKKMKYLKQQLDKYRKHIFTVFDTFHPIYFENLYRSLYHDKTYDIRKINVSLDGYNTLVLSVVTDPVLTNYVFEKSKGWVLRLITESDYNERSGCRARAWTFLLRVIANYKNSLNRAFIPEETELAKKGLVDVFNFIDKHYGDELTPSEIKTLFEYDKELTYKMFFPKLQLDPLGNVTIIWQMFYTLTKEQQVEVYKWFTLDNLVHLVKNRSDGFISMIRGLPIAVINEAVMHMLTTPNLIDDNTRNQLVSFQDITDIKIRNSLQKMSNSNNVAERNGALTSLVMATARANDLNQVNRTLKFIREKIKNESMANRADILKVVYDEGRAILLPEGVGEAQFTFFNDMLSDALESPDLDNDVYDKTSFHSHPVLKFFQQLSDMGIDKCIESQGKNFVQNTFDFSVELYWRLVVFRHGEKKAAQEQYKIKFDKGVFDREVFTDSSYNELSEELVKKAKAKEAPEIRRILSHYLTAYEKRITEKNPDWKQDFSYFESFFGSLPETWPQVPDIVENVRLQYARIRTESKKDDDGLYIIMPGDSFTRILDGIKGVANKFWSEAPMAEAIDLAMHSRLAIQMLKGWVSWKEQGCKKAREFKAAKDKYIPELLKLTPSAIHMRFVWRHLLTFQQNKIDDYIGKRKTFRGIFYQGPGERKFDRSCMKTPETRRTGGRERAAPKGRARKATTAGVINRSSGDPQQDVEEERAKEKKIKEELEDTPEEFWDHEDFFYLEACFGLHKLLPRQVNVLAKDWEVQVLNGDRATPYRVKCTARWTLMPTIAYNDIVVFMNANENPTDRHKGLSVNLIEALLRGVMRNDEPTSPLNFLLSPKFLGSDRSRVSVYAISQSVPYMPQDGLTNMLKLCLTGKRRQQLKISSYKEIIRLLTSVPTDDHLDIIFREWKRPDLHRDVRIAILVSAMQFLHSKDERFNSIAWKILEHGATLSDQHEVLTALLGTKEQNGNPLFNMTGNGSYFRNSRIVEHLDDLAKQNIPTNHAARFGEKVVAVIAKTAKNDDVKFLATGSLYNWPVLDLMLELTQKYLEDFSAESLLYSDIPAERTIYQLRWNILAGNFATAAISNSPNARKVIEVATALCTKISSMPNSERVQRILAVALAKAFLGYIPSSEINVCHYQPGEEEELMSVFKNKLANIFAVQIFQRKQAQLAYLSNNKKEKSLDRYLALLHEATVFACSYPTVAESFYLRLAADIIRANPDKTTFILKLFNLKIDAQVSPISQTADYLYLLRRVALNSIADHKHIANDCPEQTLKFWENTFDFAAERKDIPREHLKASQIFDFSTLARNILDALNYGVNSSRYDTPTYPKGTTSVIAKISLRYLETLEGNTSDNFGARVGDYLVRNGKVIAEAAPEEHLFAIVHNLILTTKDAYEIVPKIVRDVDAAYKPRVANSLLRDIVKRTLNRSKPDWGAFYVNQSRGISLALLTSHDHLARGNPDFGEGLIAEIIPQLASFDVTKGENTIRNKIKLIVDCVDTTCGYDRSHDNLANDSAFRFMNEYLPKYLSQKPEGLGTYAEQAIREIALYFVRKRGQWINVFHQAKVAGLTDLILQEASTHVIDKGEALNNLSDFANKMYNSYPKVFNDVIYLHKSIRDVPKNKQYIELSFDLAFNILKQHPSLIIRNANNVFHFLNWAISMYIREPDVTAVLNSIKTTFTADSILPNLKRVNDEEIAALVSFITTLGELKHQGMVLPQQTLLPLQSFPQYTHVSLHIAFSMIRKFGDYLRETQEKEYTWRPEFVALLDRMCACDDPQIKLDAWNTETVQSK